MLRAESFFVDSTVEKLVIDNRNNMKLYPIIYLNEGMRTPEEALEKGIAAIQTPTGVAGGQFVNLVSKKRMLDLLEKNKTLLNNPTERLKLVFKAANRAVVGSVSFRSTHVQGVTKINTSAAVNKFGPLAYQLAMHYIKPKWLCSDTSLTAESAKVWYEMYTRPELYEKKWMGDLSGDSTKLINDRLNADENKDYIDLPDDMVTDEAYMTQELGDMSKYGYLYVYRLAKPIPALQAVFDQGEAFLDELVDRGFDAALIKQIISDSGDAFFERRYD